MIFPGKDWEFCAPEEQGVNSAVLNDSLQLLKTYCGSDGVNQCVVIRNGYLIHFGPNCKETHSIWSCTKSFSSTILGLLISQGKCNLQDAASKYEPLLKGLYDKVLLRHFASMTSGYQSMPPTRYPNLKQDWSKDCYQPTSPLFEPGTKFCYWDNAQNMFGRILTNIAGESLDKYLAQHVTNKINLGEFFWEKDENYKTQGIDICYGGTGLNINAFQLARFGHLYLNKGNWDGQQVIPESWINLATSPQVSSSLPIAQTERTDMDGSGVYGFNWWLNAINRHGVKLMPNCPDLYYASGLNNNMCFIVPKWKLIFVRMGTDVNPKEGKAFVYNKVFDLLKKGIDLDI